MSILPLIVKYSYQDLISFHFYCYIFCFKVSFFHVLGEKLGLLLHYGIEATHQLREGTEVHHLQGDTEDEEVVVLQVHL